MTEKRFSYEIEKFKEELGQYNRGGLVRLLLEMKEENEQLKKELDCFKPLIFETDGKPITLYEKKDGDVE